MTGDGSWGRALCCHPLKPFRLLPEAIVQAHIVWLANAAAFHGKGVICHDAAAAISRAEILFYYKYQSIGTCPVKYKFCMIKPGKSPAFPSWIGLHVFLMEKKGKGESGRESRSLAMRAGLCLILHTGSGISGADLLPCLLLTAHTT